MTDNHICCKYSMNVYIWLPRKMLQAFRLTHQLFNSGLDIMLWGAGCDAEPRGMVLAFDKASVFWGEHSTHPTLELVFSKTGLLHSQRTLSGEEARMGGARLEVGLEGFGLGGKRTF